MQSVLPHLYVVDQLLSLVYGSQARSLSSVELF